MDSAIEMADAAATAAAAAAAPQSTPSRKTPAVPEKKYKCQFCNRAFSRSEHRSRHERSREFKFPTLVHSGVGSRGGGVIQLDSLLFFCHPHLTSPPLTPSSSPSRHERATLQMWKMSKHLRASGPLTATRSDRPCQRWRSATRQRSQASSGHEAGDTQDRAAQAEHGAGHGNAGTDRGQQ